MPKPVLFFADKLWPSVGGMESHADQFIRHFEQSPSSPLFGLVTCSTEGDVLRRRNGTVSRFDLSIPELEQVRVVFHNSGRWIESFGALRRRFPQALHVYRTGGNEIAQASLAEPSPESHRERQDIWTKHINENINLLVTNSAYTENRLRKQGITCRFLRAAGGVGPAKARHPPQAGNRLRLFCAARFVRYKNHATLIAVVKHLLAEGYDVELRLAGDGPLFDEVKMAAGQPSSGIVFLGKLSNEQVLEEIGAADYYLQLSKDLTVPVRGGSYVHTEGMGRSILEAIASGVYVIALDTGALSEIVTTARGQLLPCEASPAELSEAIGKIISQGPHRLTPTDEFAWEKVFASYQRYWEHAC